MHQEVCRDIKPLSADGGICPQGNTGNATLPARQQRAAAGVLARPLVQVVDGLCVRVVACSDRGGSKGGWSNQLTVKPGCHETEWIRAQGCKKKRLTVMAAANKGTPGNHDCYAIHPLRLA